MLLLFLSSNSNNVIVGGSREKSIDCESCGLSYTYTLYRQATGVDKSLFTWTDAASLRKAHAAALENLDRILDEEDDPEACRHCGWVQEAAVEQVRRQSYRQLREAAIAFILVGGGISFLLAAFLATRAVQGRLQAGDTLAYVLAAAGALVLTAPGLAAWGLRVALIRAYDPNQELREPEW